MGVVWAGEASKQTELITLHGGVEDWSFPTLARGDIHVKYVKQHGRECKQGLGSWYGVK